MVCCVSTLVNWHAQRECLVIPDLYIRFRFGFMLTFIHGLIFLNLLTWYNSTFRGTALAQKTQVMFFGFWWKNVFSAVRPEKSATPRGWITWCSYLWPWRQQATRVMVPEGEIPMCFPIAHGESEGHGSVTPELYQGQTQTGWVWFSCLFIFSSVSVWTWEESSVSQIFEE